MLLWVRIMREQQLSREARQFEINCASQATEEGRRDFCNRLEEDLQIVRSGNPDVQADEWQPPEQRFNDLVTQLKLKTE